MNKEDIMINCFMALVIILMSIGVLAIGIFTFQLAFADSIHIDDYRPIGRESVIEVRSFGVIDHTFQYIQTNVTVSVNNMNYTGETNRYGYIAFPIKLTDNVFDAGQFDVIISIGDNLYNKTLTVIDRYY